MELANTDDCMGGWPNDLASTCKFNAGSKKAISVRPSTRTRTKENNTETNLHRLVLGGQAVKNLHRLVLGGQTVKNLRSLELDQSGRKSSQAMASPRKPWPNGVAFGKLPQVFNLR